MHIVLFQPDIPQNVGTIMRLAACLAVPLHLVEPFGFVWDDARLRRAGMDYRSMANVVRYTSWETFLTDRPHGRLVLLTTKATEAHLAFSFLPNDLLLFGRESSGVPDEVASCVDARIKIPMADAARSLNVAMTVGIALGEALRQTGQFPVGMADADVSR